jgi:hypothetical protein
MVANHHASLAPFRLAPQDGPNDSLLGRDPVDGTVALQHRAAKQSHHSPGPRAMASSSALFTS